MELVLMVGGKILVGNFIAAWIFKTLGTASNRVFIRRLLTQQIITVGCALGYLFFSGIPTSPSHYLTLLPIFLVGVMGSSALYVKLRACAISLSRFGVFEALVGVIPITLSAYVLGEWVAFKNPIFLYGFALAIVGVGLYFASDISAKLKADHTSVPLIFYFYGLAYAGSAGTVAFLMNYWAKTEVSIPSFMAAWYCGTAVGGGVFYLLSRFQWSKGEPALVSPPLGTLKEWGLVLALGLAIFANMYFLFRSFQIEKLVVLAPFYVTFDIVGPLLLGMLLFKEWQALSKWGWLYFGMDVAGTCLIGLARLIP